MVPIREKLVRLGAILRDIRRAGMRSKRDCEVSAPARCQKGHCGNRAGAALCTQVPRDVGYGLEIDAPPKRCFQSGSTSLL